MIHDWKIELYWRLPIRVQEKILNQYAKRLDKIYYNSEYQKWKNWLKGWKSWSPSYIYNWQNERLQEIIKLAATKVPYYIDSFRGQKWRHVRSIDDLNVLPMLEKHSIQQKEGHFIVNGLNTKSLWLEKTSGTTGTSLRIYWPKSMASKWYAVYEVMCRYEAGVAQDIPRAMMGGRTIIRGNVKHPPYWRFNSKWKQLYFSSYHVSKKTAPDYIAAIEKYESQWITGYGSAIAALAENALEAGIAPYQLRSAIVSGDTLSRNMRTSIEKFFKCKCHDHYGQSEGVAMAMECSHGKMHIIPFVGLMEIVREDGSPCRLGELGEIVATSLLNDAMPFIRYRTGDYAAWAEEQTCQCSNAHSIISRLEGRIDDYLLTKDNRKIGRLSTAMKRSPSIHSAQIVQDGPGHAYLLVRPGSGYDFKHAVAVHDDIIKRIGEFSLDIREVPEIPKTPNGKTKLVVRLTDQPQMKEIYDKLLMMSNDN